mmetsp:Transcript_1172/g.1880  ORF Transcript_1172/g.1880 Transcript_1172/m.1880 type:complete len:254 (-) Transcript_1172:1002-1763(-)
MYHWCWRRNSAVSRSKESSKSSESWGLTTTPSSKQPSNKSTEDLAHALGSAASSCSVTKISLLQTEVPSISLRTLSNSGLRECAGSFSKKWRIFLQSVIRGSKESLLFERTRRAISKGTLAWLISSLKDLKRFSSKEHLSFVVNIGSFSEDSSQISMTLHPSMINLDSVLHSKMLDNKCLSIFLWSSFKAVMLLWMIFKAVRRVSIFMSLIGPMSCWISFIKEEHISSRFFIWIVMSIGETSLMTAKSLTAQE